MATAIFPGSFDPPTYGHMNIIERASRLFDKLDVVVAVNTQKKYFFEAEERLAMLTALTAPWKNVSVHLWDRLIVEYAVENKANVLLRGIRNMSDFSYEFDLSLMNRSLSPCIETLFMPTEPRFFTIKSSAIKEIAAFGGDISNMVPPLVAEAMKKKASVR
ncbi:MAG: pantetheine-phosphate adenylyltransferase [Treponema sp.]|nr:pantetheine-phosphate adenylyltransferase [Treponema sp.]